MPLRGEKQRTVLALLVLGANRVVPVDALVDALWPDRPPAAATATIQSHVSHLRRGLTRAGAEDAGARLVARGGGYLLAAEADEIDAERFEALVRAAHRSRAAGDHGAVCRTLREALGLWRGPVLADFVDAPFARGAAARLDELRLAASEELFDSELALGHHADVLAELEALAAAQPLRERLWEQRMTALFRSGRQTEALRAYQELRNTLSDELGIEPSPSVQQLEGKILAQSPELEWTGPPPRPPRSGGDVAGRAAEIFFGRGEELAALGEWLDDAAGSRGRLVLVSGEAGIGKSALLRAFAGVARRRGLAVHWGRCWEEEGAPAFWPWAEVVKSVAVARGGPPVAGSSLVDVASILSGPAPTESASPEGALASGDARVRLFEAVTELLVGKDETSAVLLEDLQEADQASLQLLRFLVRQMEDAPVLVVTTHRPASSPDAPLAAFLAGAAREPVTRRIELAPLGDDDVEGLLLASLGAHVPSPVFDAIRERADGNPFFVTELVRLVAGRGADPTDLSGVSRRGVPSGVREVVQRRLAGIGDDAVQVLALGAVAGAAFSVEVVERVAAMPSERVLEALDQAVAAQLIEETGDTYGRYRFTHSLFRDAIYEGLSGVRRARLHGAVGGALERLDAGADVARLSELAHHYAVAAPEVGVDKAVDYATRAAAHAVTQLAFEDACRLYDIALHLLDTMAPADPRRDDLALARGHALLRAGAVDRARETFAGLAERARAAGDAHLLAATALGFGGAFEAQARDDALVELLEEALAGLPPGDGPMRSRLLARLAMALYFSAPGGRRDALSGEAVAMATRVGEPAVLAHALSARYFALWDPDHLGERRRAADEALQLAEHTGDHELELDALTWTVMDAFELGDGDLAGDVMRRHADLADAVRHPRHRSYALTWQGTRAFLDGRLADAEALARQAFAAGERLSPLASARYGAQLFSIRREQGRLAELQATAEQVLADHPELWHGWRVVFAMIRVARRDPAAARQILADFLDRPDEVPFDANWLATQAHLAELCVMVGDPAQAETLERVLAPYGDRCAVIRFLPACPGSTARHLGGLAAVRGDWHAACHWLDRALHVNTRLRAATLVARTKHDYARALAQRREPGDEVRGGALRSEAAAAARSLGLQALLDEIETSVIR